MLSIWKSKHLDNIFFSVFRIYIATHILEFQAIEVVQISQRTDEMKIQFPLQFVWVSFLTSDWPSLLQD